MNFNDIKELYTAPSGAVMIQRKYDDTAVPLTKDHRQIIDRLDDIIRNRYGGAHEALMKIYEPSQHNVLFYKYRRVTRFIRCNLGAYDNVPDLLLGGLQLEFCPCPLRGGDCSFEGVLCNPKPILNITDRQAEILRYHYMGLTTDEIAKLLERSARTVKHIREQALDRLGLKTIKDYCVMATKIKLYE